MTPTKEDLERIVAIGYDMASSFTRDMARDVARYALTLLAERDALADQEPTPLAPRTDPLAVAAARLCHELESDQQTPLLNSETREAFAALSNLVIGVKVPPAAEPHRVDATWFTKVAEEIGELPTGMLAAPAAEPRVIKPGDVLRWEPDDGYRMTARRFRNDGVLMVDIDNPAGGGTPIRDVPVSHPYTPGRGVTLVHADGTPSRYPEPAPKPEAPEPPREVWLVIGPHNMSVYRRKENAITDEVCYQAGPYVLATADATDAEAAARAWVRAWPGQDSGAMQSLTALILRERAAAEARGREAEQRLLAIHDLASARLRNLPLDPNVHHDLTEIARIAEDAHGP